MYRQAGVILRGASVLMYGITLYLVVSGGEVQGVELYVTVLISCIFVGLSLLGMVVAKSDAGRTLGLVGAVLSMVVFGYSIEGYLTVKLCLGGAILITSSLAFSWPFNLAAGTVALAVGAFFQRPSALLGESMLAHKTPRIDTASELSLYAALAVITVSASLVRALSDRLREAEDTVSHLDVTIDRLSEFNQDLQRYARVADEEAITKERQRISREIHDISGYMFTNIIALMDAAVSMGGRNPEALTELHAAARAQAKEGLQETRRALRALRASDAHRERGIAAIFKIKNVFERVTGIKVTIEAGNLPPSFGPEIDMAVYRVVQEALTNAMRHGRATAVSVLFWVTDGALQLSVQDDGVGAKEIAKGIGISGMEERVGPLGGTVQAGNAPEGGFRLLVRIPLPAEAVHATI